MKRPAFTLIELLVALVLSSIVAVSLFAALRVAFKARAGAEDSLEAERTADVVFEIIRSDVESALPPRGTFSGPFSGRGGLDNRGRESDTITLHAAAAGPQHVTGTGEVKRVTFRVRNPFGTSEYVLVRRVSGNLLAPVRMEPDEEVLCRDVGSLSLLYFDGLRWRDRWDSGRMGDTLPAAVQVTLELDQRMDDGAVRGRRFVRTMLLPCHAPPPEGFVEQPEPGATP